jgi:hypothetical protein
MKSKIGRIRSLDGETSNAYRNFMGKPLGKQPLGKLRITIIRRIQGKREYLKGKINEFGTNNKNKNITDWYRSINGFKKGYNL